MCGAIEHIHRLDEPDMWQKPILQSFFVIQTDPSFESNNANGIRKRVVWYRDTVDERRTESIANQRVDRIEDAEDQNFFPPDHSVFEVDWQCGATPRLLLGACALVAHL